MKIKKLLSFQYSNDATTLLVNCTEYSNESENRAATKIEWRVTTIQNDKSETVSPETRAEAVKLAEDTIAVFVDHLREIYLTK